MAQHGLTNLTDCDDFIRGCTFMGTGGGGNADGVLDMLGSALDEGVSLRWTDVSEIPDDTWTCTTYRMGSTAPRDEASDLALTSALGLTNRIGHEAMQLAVKELAAYTGENITVVVPGELGAVNTPAPLLAAMRLGLTCVDGDYAGRAIPEEMQGTPYLYGKPSYPLASVDMWGNVVILKEAVNAYMLERIGKMLAVAAHGKCYLAATILPSAEMKEILIPGTLTKSLGIGRAIREAREAGLDPIAAAIDATSGHLLFEGTVREKDWEDRDGYMFGTVTIAGARRFDGHTLRVWYQNENQVTWLDDVPWVCSPDLVVLADRHTAEGYTSTLIDVGQDIGVVGIAGQHAFRSEHGLACAGPRHFGHDIDYQPIEEILGRIA